MNRFRFRRGTVILDPALPGYCLMLDAVPGVNEFRVTETFARDSEQIALDIMDLLNGAEPPEDCEDAQERKRLLAHAYQLLELKQADLHSAFNELRWDLQLIDGLYDVIYDIALAKVEKALGQAVSDYIVEDTRLSFFEYCSEADQGHDERSRYIWMWTHGLDLAETFIKEGWQQLNGIENDGVARGRFRHSH